MHNSVLDEIIERIRGAQQELREAITAQGTITAEKLPQVNYTIGQIDFGDRVIDEITAIGKVIYEDNND